MQITLFKTLYDNKPYYSSLPAVLASIKDGPKQLDLINQIRACSDKDEADRLKKGLAVIVFGGKFKERRAEALIEYSRLVVLDFDEVNLKVKKKELSLLPYIHAVFISPTGTGLKALVRVSSDNHLGHFLSLAKEIEGIDPSGKDVCRACFTSHDPSIYINDRSDIYAKIVETAYSDEQKLAKLKTWLDKKGQHFVTGNRNNFLAKLAGACNRFGLTQDFVLSTFERDYVQGSDFSLTEAQTVVRSMYRKTEEYGTASFDESFGEARTAEILSSELTTSDVIYLNDIKVDMIKDFEEGTPGAPTTYFPSIDVIFRPKPGDLNILSGHANFGKTNWKKQMDLVTSVMEKRKHAWFGYEEYPPQFFYKELIRTYIGKPLEKEARDRMTLEEYKRGMDFVHEYFVFVYPPSSPTPEYILERFAEVIIKHGVTSITIDPWNVLKHEMQKRDDIYLGEVLTSFERFAQQHQAYFTVINHPNRVTKNTDGNYPAPDSYDLNGGAVWAARATNIVMYHRPFYGTDKSDPTCEIHSKKIKRQMISGIPGVVQLDYNRKIGRYLDAGWNPLNEINT